MKGKNVGVKFAGALAVAGIGLTVVFTAAAGFLLGHFTGHSHHDTTTVSATSSQKAGEEAEVEQAEEAEAMEARAAEAEGVETKEAEAQALKNAEAELAKGKEGEGAEEEGGKVEEGEQVEPGGGEEGGGEESEGGAADAMAGAEVFSENCSICHGADGHGGNGGPDLRTMPLAKTQSGAEMQVTNGGGGMPAFGGTLSPEEIKNVAAYVVEEVVG